MKKYILLLINLFILSLFNKTQAQVSSYSFTQAANTFSLVTGGTVHATGKTDSESYAASIGFTFSYNCTNYTTVGISSNGFVAFGGTPDMYEGEPLSYVNSSISALGADLKGTSTSSSEIRSVMTGSAPNRVFTIQWKRFEKYYYGGDYSFQIVLYETTNKIDVNYSTTTVSPYDSYFEVGLRGASISDYNNRTKAGGTNWIASTAGTSVYDKMTISSSAGSNKNPTGKFTWTPVSCSGTPTAGTASASPSALSCSVLSSTLSVTGSSSGCGVTYQWQSSPDNSAWTNIATSGTSATYTAAPTVNTYYRRTITCAGSSANSASVQLTVPSGSIANDNCSGAISVTPNAYGSCTSAVSGDISCATSSGLAPTPCDGTPDKDLWYKFVAGSSTQFFTVSSSMDAYVQVFSGNCSALTSIYCSDPNIFTLSGLTTGQTYYFRIYYYYGGAPSDGTFTVCIQNPPTCPGSLGTGNVAIASLPYSASALTTCGAGNDITNTNSATCGSTDYLSDMDKVYTFTPATSGSVTVTINTSQSDAGATLYDGCPFSSNCIGYVQSYASGAKSFCASVVAGTTYYLVVDSYGTSGGCISSFSLGITAPSAGIANDNCSGAISVPLNAFGSCALNVSGNISCAGSSGLAPAPCYGVPDKDVWYKFVAAASTQFFTVTSTMDAYTQVFSGSCGALNSIYCSDPNTFTVSGLTAGQTYYVRIYYYYSGSPSDGTFTLCIQSPPTCPASLGSGNVAIASLPYTASGLTTCGAGNEITSTNSATCGSTDYLYDMDKVYTFTPATSGSVTVTINTSQTNAGATLYDGCPFSSNCVGFVQSYASGAKSFCTNVVAGTTYYLVVDSYLTSGYCISSFSLNITAPSAGVANDLPCNAIVINPGSSESGNNNCTTSAGEPATPSCWTTGTLNTVWYSFVATSPNMYVKTTLGTLTATQIAVYSGVCGSGLVQIGCNVYQAASGCTGTTGNNSNLDLASLVTGNTYYVRVDGQNSSTGTFSILVANGFSPTTAPVPGQDCALPLLVCNSVMTIGNPGYSATGNLCEFTGTGNCTSGEKNGVWYQINIAATGNFNFVLIPNDGNANSNGAETDYDFLLWKMSGTGTTTNCSTITSSSGTALLACNFVEDGVTGIAPSGNAPSPINTYFNSAFEPSVAVTAGDVLYLVIQNYTGSTQGFTLDMTSSGAGVVNFAAPSTVSWTGGAGTVWDNAVNWGSCSTYPVCGINAIVTVASSNQPAITATTHQYVKDLTINPGATLTLGAGTTLHVCGNFTNNGNLALSPTSTIIFDGAGNVQNISGSFTGNNKFGNIVITKSGGSVVLNSEIEIGGSFTTSNATSVFNSNGQSVYLAGNFTNSAGDATYTNTGTTGSLEFRGTGIQNYNQGTSQLDLNEVILNNTATASAGITLLTDLSIKTLTGKLVLTQGTVTTNGFKVQVLNTSVTSVPAGSASSFINGNLRRHLASSGTYEWPVGNAVKGYQRATTSFSSCSIGYIDSRFDAWPGTPPTQGGSECAMVYSYEAENNGYWTLTANAGTGGYNMTLYPLNATNTSGMSGWSVMKKPSTATGSWIMNGNCMASTATVVNRGNMSGFSIFGVAQSVTPLPIELLSFTGRSEGTSNFLQWETASEINNDYFTLERSANGIDFTEFATVDAAGNSSTQISYDKYDHAPYFGITYYRLKQTDFSGVFSYSNIIALTNGLDEISMGNVHPNPTSGNVGFDFFSPVNGYITLKMMDNTGRIVLNQLQHITEDYTKINLGMSTLAKGVYTLEVFFDKTEFTSVVKVVKN